MEKIGFIGLGDMGGPLARNLKASGADMIVYDINPKAVAALAAKGAEAAGSVAEVAKAADIVITVLPASPHVREVVLGPGGVLENAKPGTLVMDMSTIDPETTDELSKKLVEAGLAFVDSPIGPPSSSPNVASRSSWSAPAATISAG
ncbi:NAD(P)-binding domain-containing protein [Nisaea acidiphila]|uniref:NAD(P)-binding domain-containing protein n=1 Tax=Nisaea acidiphila TaxID=1862145 RepID=A0A9J7ANV9_9PROT|nr:NAD(P)-binding domain-containing protein [Nisaea acidiphila]UUX48854.1 NAD(P)-binding domain-containing protein [Nisaea acidiphila]